MDASNRARLDELAGELAGLTTCQGRIEWERRARDEVSGIQKAIADAYEQMKPVFLEQAEMKQELEHAKSDFQQQPILTRVFGKHSTEKAIEARIAEIDQWLLAARLEISQFKEAVEKLDRLLEFVMQYGPRTLVEKTDILADLHRQRKELQIRKREITKATTEIRREARTASTDAGKILNGWLYDSSLAASQRRDIRAAKEDALHPYESEKADIEEQMISIDRHILFVEQFRS